MSDAEFFASHRDKTEYVRAPLPGEFADVTHRHDHRVRVYFINRRTVVKALESGDGERLATLIETIIPVEPRAAA